MTAAVSRAPECEVRVGKPDDLPFVVDCWTKNDPELRKMKLGEATRHVRALIARDLSRLIVAHVPGEPDAILGWAVYEDSWRDGGAKVPPCVHYVYVRSGMRGRGVASTMIQWPRDARLEYSHEIPKRWPLKHGQTIGDPVVVPKMWTLNLKRAETE